jgi:putative CocE/NonD family hydrolase
VTLLSRFAAAGFKLPPPRTRRVDVERDLRVEMPDGVELLADHYAPRLAGAVPTVLLRSPYGRRGGLATVYALIGRLLAERGNHVVVQSVRGTFGSGGEMDYKREADDGRATVAWLSRQSWFDGRLGTFGPSYLGFTQWALASSHLPQHRAMAVQVIGSERRTMVYSGEPLAMDSILSLLHTYATQDAPLLKSLGATRNRQKLLAPAYAHLPVGETDRVATGRTNPIFQEWLSHEDAADPYWEAVDYRGAIPDLAAPVCMVGGWYDYYLPHLLGDFERLRAAGKQARLLVGPWHHVSLAWVSEALRQGLEWFEVHLAGHRGDSEAPPVRVFLTGADRWLEMEEWPPPGTEEVRWHLHAAGALGRDAPVESSPDAYRYDPADPTPSVGGTSISANCGAVDNRALEARADVVVYTSAALERDLDVVGAVAADLFVRSSLEHTDFFCRLCDVGVDGRSTNICDGIVRLKGGRDQPDAGGVHHVRVEMWPTAHRFLAGNRVRVQVSSGAHPRFARNLGTGEPLLTGTAMNVADQEVLHDPAHPSAIILSEMVASAPGRDGR